MDYLLGSSVLGEIYSYIDWYDLRYLENVPDIVWRKLHDVYCEDIQFREKLTNYWGEQYKIPYKILPYKVIMLNYIDFSCKYLMIKNVPKILSHNKEFTLERIIKYKITEVDNKFNDNHEVMLECIKTDPRKLLQEAQHFRNDKNFMLDAVKLNGYSILCADYTLCYDPQLLYEAAKEIGILNPDHVKQESLDAKIVYQNIAIDAIKKYGAGMLYYLNPSVITNAEFPLITEHINTINKIRDDEFEMWRKTCNNADRNTTLEAVKQGCPYRFVKFQNDKEIAFESAKHKRNNAEILCMPSNRQDRKIVLEIVKNDGFRLSDIDEKFIHDKEVVLCAVKQCGYMLKYAATTLLRDKNFMLEILHENRTLFIFIDDSLKSDPEFLQSFLKTCF